ncbi:hypothetical protein D9M70_572680 [compost metagenome]
MAQGVGVNRLAEVVDVGDFFGFFRGGGQANLRGRREILKNLAPGRVGCRAATMAFVDDDQIEEITAELLVDVSFFFRASDGLIQRQINLIRFVGLPLLDLGHGRTKRFEIVGHGLIDQNVTVG